MLAAAAAVVASRAQARLWRDTVTVLSHSDAVAPGSGMVEYNLGSELGRRGRLGEAEDLLRRAVRHADTSEAHNQLANVLLLSGRGQEAADHYERAVAIEPRNAEALYNLARVLEGQGRLREARERYAQFVQVAPPWLQDVKRQVQAALAR